MISGFLNNGKTKSDDHKVSSYGVDISGLITLAHEGA